MVEIRIHGRGGQGGVTLAKIVATSRFLQGQSVQAFGLYAAERSGAPLQAFCRYDDAAIANRNLIYAPDHVVVLDPTLVGPGVASGLKPGGWILINTPEPPETFAEQFPHNRLATVDATSIARDNRLGTRSVPIVNTALAGAVGALLGIALQEIRAALEHLGFRGGNETAAGQAYERVRRAEALQRPPRGVTEATGSEAASSPFVATGRGPSFLEGAGGGLPGIRTGEWATQQPKRQQYVPPCNHVCPAGNDVQGFLHALARDDADEALAILLRTTPFPATCGRVCPAPCMDSCNRIELDGAVNVRQLERFAGDRGRAEVAVSRARPECVAVVGSGPAGLSAAYQLARLGYPVTVHEAGPQIGGLLRTGIPRFRLPEDVLDREVGRVLGLGVRMVTDHPIDRAGLLELSREFDAVLVATGLQELRGLRLGVGNSEAVEQGIDFLDRSHRDEVRVDGEDVVVVGGGNTAMDAARSALRLGANSVRVVYRRTRREMPAIREEIDEALEEGIPIDFLTQPVLLRPGGSGNGAPRSYRLTCRRMELGAPDASGRRRPVEVQDSDFEISCHRLILALGQSPDMSVFPEGTEVREGERLLGLLETPVFAVGDLATNEGTVAGAIGSGRRSALQIHAALNGEHLPITEHARARPDVEIRHDEVIRADAMRLHLFERQPVAEGAHVPPEVRRSTFDEIHMGLPDAGEAQRCLSCGVCNECDLCVTYCPEGVLKRVGHDLVFDSAYCKGCGVCVTECPRNVILMSHL
ncbi:MAG: 2-oxoacid:acceptor oxidoreductase family protein [Gemmatimonadota bacterium]|nr:MAG: 2-oxoacid:acceptor oxidoreductase family protein [Gemmatimonadota bacterium]